MRDSEADRLAVFELLAHCDRREKIAELIADILFSVAILVLIPAASFVLDALFSLTDALRLFLLLIAPASAAALVLPGFYRIVRLRPDYKALAARIEAARPDLRSELITWTDLETSNTKLTAVESETAGALAVRLAASLPRLLPEPSGLRLKRGALVLAATAASVVALGFVFRGTFAARLNRVLRPSIPVAIVPVRVSEININNRAAFPGTTTVLATGRRVDIQLEFVGLAADASPVVSALDAAGDVIETYPLTRHSQTNTYQVETFPTRRTSTFQIRNGADILSDYPVQFIAPPSVERVEVRIQPAGGGAETLVADGDASAPRGSTATIVVRTNRPPAYDRLGNVHKVYVVWHINGEPPRKTPLTRSGDVFITSLALTSDIAFETAFIDEYGYETPPSARRSIVVR